MGRRLEEIVVARFFFNVRDGAYLLKDEEGIDLPSIDHARAQALQSTRELLAEAIKSGGDLSVDAVVVADEQGNEITSIAIKEALPKRLR
jgi:hypothetical protein